MSKIMCDVCGTVFQDSSGICPICGWVPPSYQDSQEEVPDDDFDFDDIILPPSKAAQAQARAGAPSRMKSMFSGIQGKILHRPKDEDDADPDSEDEQEQSEETPDSERPFNSMLVIILLVIIAILLASTGYLFFRYYLPNRHRGSGEASQVITYEPETSEEETETTIPTVPCTGLVLTSGPAELSSEGQNWLLHVKVMPEDTTDQMMYISEDTSVATVSDDGRVTAVGEGSTSIVITCGSQLIRSRVTVDYSLAPTEVPATLNPGVQAESAGEEAEAAADQTEAAEAASETTEETAAETTAETTAETKAEAATETTAETTAETTVPAETKPGIKLKLKNHDLSLTKGYNTTLIMACDLTVEEVQWSTDDPTIAKVENGVVYALKKGSANITATYGDQKDVCIIRVREK